MNISLTRFLRTGYLGEIYVGSTAEDIQLSLGPPEAIAKSFRKQRHPDIWLYGGVEFWFDQSEMQACRSIWIERMGHGWRDEFKMPAGSLVKDWNLQPYQPRDVVEAYLRRNDIFAFQPEPKKADKNGYVFAPRNLVIPASGATLAFDEEWRLNAFLAQPVTE